MLEVVLERGIVRGQRLGDALDHYGEDGDGAGIGVAGVAVTVAEACDAEGVLHAGDADVGDGDDGCGEEEVEPEERGRLGDVRDGRGGELVDDGGVPRKEVERECHRYGRDGDGGEDEERGALEEEELRGVGAAVERDLRRGGVVDGEELGGERGGPRDAAVVEAELDEEEQQDAGGGPHGGDVDEVLDAAVPRLRLPAAACVRRLRGRAHRGRRRGPQTLDSCGAGVRPRNVSFADERDALRRLVVLVVGGCVGSG